MTPLATPGFLYAAHAARVLFGQGRVSQLASELEALGVTRVLFICTRSGESRYKPVIDALGHRCVRVFAGAQPHCPEMVALAALDAFQDSGADGVVTVGGGSTIALGKVISARRRVPFLAVPTTLSGSEMTALYGMKIDQEKRTWVDPAAKPRTVVYDPDLTTTLPRHETATTGMNCLAHCVEALYPATPNPIARLLALDAIGALGRSLPGVIARNDTESRAGALYGGFVGGLLVSMVGIGLHHKICHVLGGHFDLPHGETNSVILPHVVAFNAPALPAMARDVADALSTPDAAGGIFDLAVAIGAPTSLRLLGLKRLDLRAVAEEVVARGTHNPRPISVDAIAALLLDAFEGRRPSDTGGRRPFDTDPRLETGDRNQANGKHQGGHHVRSSTQPG